ncbi:MAG TPA: prephenate dehydratase domain-containing protein [Candidatus Paceibacterota bacterium]|nr:prephenate dehydratase domain-containing protein [Candidatus Paceibacterota bacterium]
MKIGVSGVRGSFSEQAGRQYAASVGVREPEMAYLTSVEGVLSALDAGSIERGVFPVENSTGGIVIEAVYAMAKHLFDVETMFELEIHQNLLVKPGTKAEHITRVVSHDQALKQCRMYLKRKWPGIDMEEYPDTAKAAQDLANGVLKDSDAVIASKNCAEMYGLDLLEESIQDLKYNFTNFVVAKKG